MNRSLQEVLGDQLSGLPSNYHIHTDIMAILHAIEKECAKTANYAKRHGDEFHYYMKMYHPEVYLFPFARACGGSPQDIGLEGCPAVYMNLCYLVPFFFDLLHQ